MTVHIAMVFSDHKARDHWLRAQIIPGQSVRVYATQRVIEGPHLHIHALVIENRADTDLLRGIAWSAIIMHDKFRPFDGWFTAAMAHARG